MAIDEKRKESRIASQNLISYVCCEKDNRVIKHGMGRTLNVSEGGILLETHVPLESEQDVSLTIGLEEEMMDIKGKVTFCKERKEGRYENGIQFEETDKRKRRILKQFIVMFKEEEDKL